MPTDPPRADADAAALDAAVTSQRQARRADAAARLDERGNASQLTQAEAVERWAIIDETQRRLRDMPGGLSPEASWSTGAVLGLVLLVTGLVTGPRDPSWWAIGAYLVFVIAVVVWIGLREQGDERTAGFVATERRRTRSGRSLGLPGGTLVAVEFWGFHGSGLWWIGLPMAAIAILWGRWRVARWYGVLHRPPKIRPGGGKARHDHVFDDEQALRLASALALVDWARPGVLVRATGLDDDVVGEAAASLYRAGYATRHTTEASAGGKYRIELTGAGRKAFAHHVDWLENPGPEPYPIATRSSSALWG